MKRKFNQNRICIRYSSELDKLDKFTKSKNEFIILEEVDISINRIPIDLSKIPQSVHTLRFNYNFENLPHEIPSNITRVYFEEFSDLLEDLPNTIEHVQIYKGFNNPVDNLGDHFKSIDFGCDFNHQVDNLPTSLEKVVFSISFNHSINNLPSNIKFIHILNPHYNFDSIKKLPKSLILLQLDLSEKEFDLNEKEFSLNNKKCILLPHIKKNNINIEGDYQFTKNFFFYNE